jgi:hypothetical protein
VGLRIFLSYGRDEYAFVAERISALLAAHGHEVWFDRERLTGGVDWEHSIEQGLEWVGENPAQGRVVLVMTPHSVRRPDGFCLNELARALQRQLSVVPVMLVEVEPPLSICRLQWVDMTTCLPLPNREDVFERQVGLLTSALERGEVAPGDVRGRLTRLLKPLDFEYEISSVLEDFATRPTVVHAVDMWLAEETAEPVFWLTGGVGTGKTTIALWLAAQRRAVSAWHFCRYGHPAKADPRRCVMSLAYQLATQLPEYATQLAGLELDRILDANERADALFEQLMLEPLRDLPKPDRQIVAMVDGLDEATIDGRNELADLIDSYSGKPSWLRLLVTSRPEAPIASLLRGARRFDLDLHERETVADLTAFVVARLPEEAGSLREAAAAAIVERAGGTFLYARAVLDDIAGGRLAVGDLSRLPSGLGGIFWRLFERQFPDTAAYRERVRPLLELLAAERAPLPLGLVSEILNWGPYDQHEVLTSVGSLCVTVADAIQPFHASIVEWVSDTSDAGPYWVDATAGHRRLADAAAKLDVAGSGSSGAYLVDNSVAHMIEAGTLDDLARLLSNPTYLEQRLKVHSTDSEDRRSARFAHRDDIRQLAGEWPADADGEPVVRCMVEFVEVAWRVIEDTYEPYGADTLTRWHIRWDEAAGLLTSCAYLADGLATEHPRWVSVVPLVFSPKLHKLLSSHVLLECGSYDGPYFHLRGAVEMTVKALAAIPQLRDWYSDWVPVPYAY